MYPVSSYERTKAAALAHEVDYGWNVGSGYDNRIPTSVFANGFGQGLDDLSQYDANADPYTRRNLPAHRQNLYEPESDEGTRMGFYLWEPERALLDLAPVIPKNAMPVWQQVASCLNGHAQLPKGHQLAHTRPSRSYNVSDVAAVPLFDPGNNLGLLFDAPALGPYQRGRYTVVQSFYK